VFLITQIHIYKLGRYPPGYFLFLGLVKTIRNKKATCLWNKQVAYVNIEFTMMFFTFGYYSVHRRFLHVVKILFQPLAQDFLPVQPSLLV